MCEPASQMKKADMAVRGGKVKNVEMSNLWIRRELSVISALMVEVLLKGNTVPWERFWLEIMVNLTETKPQDTCFALLKVLTSSLIATISVNSWLKRVSCLEHKLRFRAQSQRLCFILDPRIKRLNTEWIKYCQDQ